MGGTQHRGVPVTRQNRAFDRLLPLRLAIPPAGLEQAAFIAEGARIGSGGRVAGRFEGHAGRESGPRARAGQRHPVWVIGCPRDEDLVPQLRDLDPGTRSELVVIRDHEHERVGGKPGRAYSGRAGPGHAGVAVGDDMQLFCSIYIHFPDHDTLMFIDVVNAGWIPICNLNLSDDVIGYTGAPAIALDYPWTHLISGHLGRAATREIFTRTTTFAIMQSIRLDRGPSGPVHP
jgi:hypothetical protein